MNRCVSTLQTTGSWSYWDKLKALRPSCRPPAPAQLSVYLPLFLLCPFVWLRVSSRWHRPSKLLLFFFLLLFARRNNLGAPCLLRRTTALPANLQMGHCNLSSCEMTMVNLGWITCDEIVHMVIGRTDLLLALEWRYMLFNGRHQITCLCFFIFWFCVCVYLRMNTHSHCAFYSCYIKTTARQSPPPQAKHLIS